MSRRFNLTGERFGRLTVLSDTDGNDRSRALCECECGAVKAVLRKHLLTGAIISCGCARFGTKRVAKAGDRYGRLTLVKHGENRDGLTTWECECDCGNTVNVKTRDLRKGDTKSCGCLFEDTPKQTPQMKKARKFYTDRNYADETHEALIRKRDQIHAHNQSGVRGVHLRRNGKYEAVINFKKKRYSLGKFDDLKTAAAVRHAAEYLVYDAYLEDGLDIQYKTAADLRDACWRFISSRSK